MLRMRHLPVLILLLGVAFPVNAQSDLDDAWMAPEWLAVNLNRFDVSWIGARAGEDTVARGYAVQFFPRQDVGPFEVFGSYGVATLDLENRFVWTGLPFQRVFNITTFSGGARWRPIADDWGFHAAATRTYDGVGGRFTVLTAGLFVAF